MAKITTTEELRAKLSEMRTAQRIFSTYTQEQVDKICYAVTVASIQNRISLAKMAVQETQMGILEDKILKNHYAAEFVYHQYRNLKTCGVIETDKECGVQKIAAPVGILGAILQMTNPTASAIFHILLCLKTRNAVLISPHPKAKNCTCAAVEICAQTAYRAGAPEGVIDCIAEPTTELSTKLMQSADLVLATGGTEIVQTAYASGKPSIGAGGGNCPVIIHKSANICEAVCAIIQSKTFDAGLLCSSEQAVIVEGEANMEGVKREFQKQGGYILSEEECKRVRELLATSASEIAGKKAEFIAQLAGIKVPVGAKLLLAQVSEISQAEPLAQEKLFPILALYQAESYFQALDMAEQLLQLGGAGHTAGLYIDPKEEKDLALWRDRMKACRLLVNSPTSQGAIGGICNGLPPALMLGCGTWGNSGFAGNLEPKQLLNIKLVALRWDGNLALRLPREVYHEAGDTRKALMELWKTEHFQRVFFLTDHYLYQNGNAAPVLNHLERMGVLYAAYYDITPNLTMEQVDKGVTAIEGFHPDVIIGMGGGTALDGAKLMRLRYEYPDVSWEALQLGFLDCTKRVLETEKSKENTLFVTIATTAGTSAAGTPYAVVTDEKTGISYPVYHPGLLPTVSILDAEQMRTMPKGLMREGGLSTLVRAMESYLSLCATDYTDGFSLFACRTVWNELSQAYAGAGQDERALEKLCDASGLADMAMANTFPGLIYSMACALSSWHHLPHGVACGILLPEVMQYEKENDLKTRKMTGNRPYPDFIKRWETMARFCGVQGTSAEDCFQRLHSAIRQLQGELELYPTIQAYGVEEAYFLDSLDRMTEAAWNNHWIRYSPIEPQIEEIRGLYLRCYYGETWNGETEQ